eukprot:TRINITY_DN26266_c0_g1_i1.p1 TRINITY_DN26266_c0_g1~~TRINITY_DN26266_c0_g1_i1.p1  ORF type:complete len:328 (+),score=42.37 TRINITY_DN26266_c0_g1_i1:105-1088(+)
MATAHGISFHAHLFCGQNYQPSVCSVVRHKYGRQDLILAKTAPLWQQQVSARQSIHLRSQPSVTFGQMTNLTCQAASGWSKGCGRHQREAVEAHDWITCHRHQARTSSRESSSRVSSSPESPPSLDDFSSDDDISTNSAIAGGAGESGNGVDGPSGNALLAIGTTLGAAALFVVMRFSGGGMDLSTLAATSASYEQALSNGRPTVIEFYADWCEVCRELAGEVYEVEQQYKDKVNFVMMNIDNEKWTEELNEFGVDGIPHMVFLDAQGNEEGYVVGKFPRRVLQENLEALARGDPKVPYSQIVGQYSSKDGSSARIVSPSDPRSHGV